MAVTIKHFKEIVERSIFELAEYWCLCKCCSKYHLECEDFDFWIRQLRIRIDNLKLIDIKNGVDKKTVLIQMLIRDYELNKSGTIIEIIDSSFDKDIFCCSEQKESVAIEFANSVLDLIDVISEQKSSTYFYLYDRFQYNLENWKSAGC